jgi:hypothetical protein
MIYSSSLVIHRQHVIAKYFKYYENGSRICERHLLQSENTYISASEDSSKNLVFKITLTTFLAASL